MTKTPEQRWREKPSVRVRMTTKEWRERLLEERDTIIINAKMYKLEAKKIFDGVVEVFIPDLQEF